MGKIIGVLLVGGSIFILGLGLAMTGVFFALREDPGVFHKYAEISQDYVKDRFEFRLDLRRATKHCLRELLPTAAPKFYEDSMVNIQMLLVKQQSGEGKRKRYGGTVLKRAFKTSNWNNKRLLKSRIDQLSHTRARDLTQFHNNFSNDPTFFFLCTFGKMQLSKTTYFQYNPFNEPLSKISKQKVGSNDSYT